MNLYGFVGNDGVDIFDCLGRDPAINKNVPPPDEATQKKEVEDLASKLGDICSNKKCLDRCAESNDTECKNEAKKIAEAYVKRVYELRKGTSRKRGDPLSDVQYGWLCYDWTQLVMPTLKSLGLKVWKIDWVGTYGFVSGGNPPRQVYHNFLFASLGSPSGNQGPVKDCGKILDPWWFGKPDIFDAENSSRSHNWNFIQSPNNGVPGKLWNGKEWIDHTFRPPVPQEP